MLMSIIRRIKGKSKSVGSQVNLSLLKYEIMKNLLLLTMVLFCSISFVSASNGLVKKPDQKLKYQEFVARSQTVVGKAKWINETTFRCKGKKPTCAIFHEDGAVHVFMVVYGGGDENSPTYQGFVESYEMIEGEEEGEQFTEIYFTPSEGEE